ncbi:amino acid permease [Macrococcus hajekii]|uniref:Amino acid permease n=1 Tax=Macrococcus hajekii TaxID=198482 RepID=A0A4R6BL95_9STAP|nr:amino acid permease [Macrococcus hajekii]TDM02543.1 amino acid permease [Macrococcus hajekii]GGB01821.1 putative amino acid permease YbgF [Macrococcus hajekii]
MANEFRRGLEQRHVMMLSFGGVIGTGLFLSTGYTLQQAGPIGTVVSYIVGALLVYMIMKCLGALAVKHPDVGGFHTYANIYIHPSVGHVVAWSYWLCWTIAIGSEITAGGILFQKWLPNFPVWLFSLIFIAIIIAINLTSSRIYGEAEFWLSLVKVLAIVAFILIGLLILFNVIPSSLKPVTASTQLFDVPNGLFGIFITMLAVNYAFSGTELIAIAAGETKNPESVIPKAIRATIWRLVLLFIGTIVIMVLLLPTDKANLLESPFVSILDSVGVPYAGDIMNFIILTALLSAANSGLYAASRMLWSLSEQDNILPVAKKLSSKGMPVNATLISLAGALLSLLSSVIAPTMVYLVLVSVAGFAVVVVWMSICLSRINQLKAEGVRKRSAYILPVTAFTLCLVSCIGVLFDPNQRLATLIGLPFCLIVWLIHYTLTQKKGDGIHETAR